LEVLAEVMPVLRRLPGYDAESFQVFIDGGIRRGADVFKAVALGARAVGIGRPVLYSLASFGEQGVNKMLQGFKLELEMTMRLMGTPCITDVNESLVLAKDIASGNGGAVRDLLSESLYEPLETQAQREKFVRSKI
jgi:L-lactate dehydrogenase (cytochrome)